MEYDNIPTSVNVMGVTYKVRTEKSELNRDHLGLCRSFQCDIIIDSEVKENMRKAVLLHEIFHAISDAVGARLDENQITGMSRGMFGVMRDNLELVRWLMEQQR